MLEYDRTADDIFKKPFALAAFALPAGYCGRPRRTGAGCVGVQALADLPSKEQLLGMVAATLLAPITGLARALNGNIQNLAYALEAVRKQKESA